MTLHRNAFVPIAMLLATLLPTPVSAPAFASEVLPKEQVDRIVGPLVDEQYAASVVVGLIDEHGTQFLGYGSSSDSSPKPPDHDTVFEIGSVTKVFTGTLLAETVEDKAVSLDDPVRKYLPAAVKVPAYEGREITLLDLATQHSGLPRMPNNFHPKDPDNPYADYTADDLYAFLASCKLQRKPGESYEYSNLGMGLLGQALSRKAGESYEKLVIDRIADPLRMNDTRITLTDGMRMRLAPGHDADGNPVHNWDIPTLAGAGALRSTADDLLKFIAANLGLSKSELAPALKLAQEDRGKVDDGTHIGLAWHINVAHQTRWHNGQTGGYHSFVAFDPARRRGVVVLSNTATGYIDEVGSALMKRLGGEPADPPKLRKTVPVAGDVLEKYAGTYALSPVVLATVTKDGDRLFFQLTGQPKFRIYPESETTFFWKVVDAQVTFERNEAGKATKLTLHQNGRDLAALKVK